MAFNRKQKLRDNIEAIRTAALSLIRKRRIYAVEHACDSMVKIPQFGTIGSLNVSVASSILIYEVVRQRMNEQAQ